MFGLSLFRPSRQSNISTSGEERFKYPLPRENKISQMPYPRDNKDNQIPTLCPAPPPPPRRLYIDRCIIPSSKTTYKAAAFSHKEYNSRNIFVIKQLGYYGKVPIPLKISCMPSVLKKLENRFFKSHRYLVLVICNFKLYWSDVL